MVRRPQIDEDETGGLDSLLDTMTNVVGILVMVLIAAQLGVKDAVGRIAESDVVDPVAVEAARAKLQLTKDQRDKIRSQLNDTRPVDESTIQVRLADLRRQLSETRIKLNRENTIANQFTQRIEEDRKKANAAREQIKEYWRSRSINPGRLQTICARIFAKPTMPAPTSFLAPTLASILTVTTLCSSPIWFATA